jgi:hypothetical protein
MPQMQRPQHPLHLRLLQLQKPPQLPRR